MRAGLLLFVVQHHPPKYPRAPEHAEPEAREGDPAHGGGDFQIMGQPAKLVQNPVPIMAHVIVGVAPAEGCHEVELERTRVGDIPRHSKKIRGEPDEGERVGEVVALPPEHEEGDDWHEALHERAAEHGEEFPKRDADEMAQLVDAQIQAVEEAAVVHVARVVDGEPAEPQP